MTDLARDMWTYISLGYFRQSVKPGEVGSSTMPHKVNPIDFENAEANFGLAHALLDFMAAKLPISRLQRDLSDSSVQRALGEALGHFLVGCKSLSKGLAGVSADTTKIADDLVDQWAVLTEAVQTLMRRYQIKDSYEAIKKISRGQSLTYADYLRLVDSLTLPEAEKIPFAKSYSTDLSRPGCRTGSTGQLTLSCLPLPGQLTILNAMSVDVIIGLQRGDEGKGRFVDLAASDYDVVARGNGGANAGHTIVPAGMKPIALHQIPSGIAYKSALILSATAFILTPENFGTSLNNSRISA